MPESPSSEPRPIPAATSETASGRRVSTEQSAARTDQNARLAYPVPSYRHSPATWPSPLPRRSPVYETESGAQTPLHGSYTSRASGPGASALTQALSASIGRSPPRVPVEIQSPDPPGANDADFGIRTTSRANYGSFQPESFQAASGRNTPQGLEDFDIIRRHLAGPAVASPTRDERRTASPKPYRSGGTPVQVGRNARGRDADFMSLAADGDEFSSLRMQGGDITREIYRRTEAEAAASRTRMQRSQSYGGLATDSRSADVDINTIHQPGGFRREHIRRNVTSPARKQLPNDPAARPTLAAQPSFITRNFFEFLSLYGHFAGEELDDDDSEGDEEEDADRAAVAAGADECYAHHFPERRPLLRHVSTRRARKGDGVGKKGVAGTVFILLKSFIGTGVLFLPRAFLNGGMLFSTVVLLAVAAVSYYCFILLTTSRLALHGSYAEMGEMVHGRWLRLLINASLVISQVGFASAYIVFTSENLQAFILAVSDCRTYIDIKLMILMQLIVFLPLSLYRNLNNISYVVYIADLFIVLGLVYLYYYDIATLVMQHGMADIAWFNRSGWTLFIGTAIFTFEGIGLLIPIQDGMKNPAQLPAVLGGVMIIMTLIFVSMGALSYAAYGSKTRTVIILNMPQDNRFVNGVQFLYSLAILLSTPMQIFPAITILEKGVFTRSGKYSKNIKWKKNGFRFMCVICCAMIAWLGANDLDKFVALVGSFACIPLVYIYPVGAGSCASDVADG